MYRNSRWTNILSLIYFNTNIVYVKTTKSVEKMPPHPPNTTTNTQRTPDDSPTIPLTNSRRIPDESPTNSRLTINESPMNYQRFPDEPQTNSRQPPLMNATPLPTNTIHITLQLQNTNNQAKNHKAPTHTSTHTHPRTQQCARAVSFPLAE